LRPFRYRLQAWLWPFALGCAWLPPAIACAAEAGTTWSGYDSRQFTDPRGYWAALATGGNVEAMYGLGLVYDLGNGTPRDPALALYWYRKAAEAGSSEAAFNAGVMYDSGRGTPRDAATAALWYARSAVRGHRRAQFNLGLLYEAGDGVPRNLAVARIWFRAAAEGGLSAAAVRAKTLTGKEQAGRRVNTVAGGAPSQPVYPVQDTVVATAPDTVVATAPDTIAIPLIWNAPADTGTPRFEIEVREADGPSRRDVYLGVTDQTATLVTLPARSAVYVWRVDLLVGDHREMIASDWAWFIVKGPATGVVPPGVEAEAKPGIRHAGP
jgi:Sel1 repeat-containing protein